MSKKKEKSGRTFSMRQDERYLNRLPDYWFKVVDLPGVVTRHLTLDVSDGGVVSTLHVIIPEGSRPKRMVFWANKDVVIEDVWGRRLVPEKFWIETFRARASGSEKRKIISFVPGVGSKITASPECIFNRFDAVFALDTNTKLSSIGGDVVSVLGLSTNKLSRLKFPGIVYVESRYCIEFRNLQEPREKYGWYVALQLMYGNGWLKSDDKVGLIIDAYQNEIMGINNGEPLFENIFLPDNVKLIYASSDTGQFFAVNKSIRQADKISSLVMDQIFKNKDFHFVENCGPFDFCSAVRLWRVSDDGQTLIGESWQD